MLCPFCRYEVVLIVCCVVVCEKPFTPTSKEADELNAIAKQKGKLLAVFQSMSIQLYRKHVGY